MNHEIISFIEISYEELRCMPIKELEIKINQNIQPYFRKIHNMSTEQLMSMKEDVKETRKQKFRFSQEITKNITRERIQVALSSLAILFRKIEEEIKDQENT